MSFIVLIPGQKQSHPHGDDQSEMTKKRIDNNRNITESKKYGCVCTCYHRNDLPWYNCVTFVKHNYNLNILTVITYRCIHTDTAATKFLPTNFTFYCYFFT